MQRFVPPFILNRFKANDYQGMLNAYVLLIDIADFTKTSTTFQKEGKKGAEEMRQFLDTAFRAPIEIITSYGGFVSLFAGDAVCVIFPDVQPEQIISAVSTIKAYFHENVVYKTAFGDFPLKVRQTICHGRVDWQIYVNDLQNEYVFSGDVMKELAELSSCKEDVVFSETAAMNIGIEQFSKLKEGYALFSEKISEVINPLVFSYHPDTMKAFINPKYLSDNPQDEIRSAAYCFANLEDIEPRLRESAIATIQIHANRYGGFVNKYDATDKGLIAIILFGLPRSEEKTLNRICDFSLEIVRNVPELALGISCGNVFAGFVGGNDTIEYTALGQPLNLAARLMSKARAGEVLTDTYLWQEMNAHYDFDYLGSLNLKGMDLPIRYYHINQHAQDKSWHKESRFVGRENELTTITSFINKGIENKENSIIYVSGDAGIGKSRLIKEVLAIYPVSNYHKFTITCDAILPKPLEAIKQIIRSYFYYNAQMPLEAGSAMFRGLWSVLVNNDTELMRIESIIASLLDYKWENSVWSMLPAEEKPSQLKKAFIRFMKQITNIKPVLIHLDDAQWLDVQSHEYLQELSSKAITPVIIISACRYLESGERVDLELSNYERNDIDLNCMDDTSSLELIQTKLRLKHIPDGTQNLIINRAMGNPLFIEQLTSYLMETGSINDKGNITGEVGYLSSFSISDIVSSRIDRLTEQVRECMFNASVLGMEFNVKVLSEMLKTKPQTELESGIKNRIWKDLDELRYIFTHILIKDIVYQRMVTEKLQKLHQTAAEAMEIIFADKLDEIAEEIAYHFEKGNCTLKAADFYDKAGCFLGDKYDFNNAEINLNKGLHIRERLLGADHPHTVMSQIKLGNLYESQGNYAQAESLFLSALEIREKVLGADHHDTTICFNNLGLLYYYQGKYTQAEPLFLRALAIREKVLDADHPDTARSLNNLGLLYESQGKYTQAEPLYLRALQIWLKVLGSEHPDTVICRSNLGLLYESLGNFTQAESLLLSALEMREKILGAEHPDTATCLTNLGLLYYYQGKHEQAELLYLRALAIKEIVLGVEHHDTATCLHNLATLYESQGKYEQAEPLYLRALKITEEVLGAEHPETAISLNNLGLLYYSQGKYDRTESLFLRSISIFEKNLGDEHPYIAISLNRLASLYNSQGKFDQAESLFHRSLSIFEKAVGAEHPNTVISLIKLACFYESLSKHTQAEPLYVRALETREKVLGSYHPDTIKILEQLISFYDKIGDAKKKAIYDSKLAATEQIHS